MAETNPSTTQDQTARSGFKRAAAASAFPDAKGIYRMTAEAASHLAEKRNFAPGHEQKDCEAARAEMMAQLEKRKG